MPLGTGVLGQFSLAGNCVAALYFPTRVLLAGNHISDEQRKKEQESAREKRQRNLRNLSEESLERSRGRRRRQIFNEELYTVKLREIEQETVHLFTTFSLKSGNVFLLN